MTTKAISDYFGTTGFMIGMVITGGGMSVVTETTKHGGASKWFYGASLPYHPKMARLWMAEKAPAVSRASAVELALSFYEETGMKELRQPTIAISSTSKLTYEGERAGREHCAFITIIKTQQFGESSPVQVITTYRLDLQGNTRALQEAELTITIVSILAHHTKSNQVYQASNLQMV